MLLHFQQLYQQYKQLQIDCYMIQLYYDFLYTFFKKADYNVLFTSIINFLLSQLLDLSNINFYHISQFNQFIQYIIKNYQFDTLHSYLAEIAVSLYHIHKHSNYSTLLSSITIQADHKRSNPNYKDQYSLIKTCYMIYEYLRQKNKLNLLPCISSSIANSLGITIFNHFDHFNTSNEYYQFLTVYFQQYNKANNISSILLIKNYLIQLQLYVTEKDANVIDLKKNKIYFHQILLFLLQHSHHIILQSLCANLLSIISLTLDQLNNIKITYDNFQLYYKKQYVHDLLTLLTQYLYTNDMTITYTSYSIIYQLCNDSNLTKDHFINQIQLKHLFTIFQQKTNKQQHQQQQQVIEEEEEEEESKKKKKKKKKEEEEEEEEEE